METIKYRQPIGDSNASQGGSVALENGDRCCHTDHLEGSTERTMIDSNPITKNGYPNRSEPTAETTIHLVCRQCDHEDLHDSWGDAFDDAKEHATENADHAVSFGRVSQ